jgi:hypothetical protein
MLTWLSVTGPLMSRACMISMSMCRWEARGSVGLPDQHLELAEGLFFAPPSARWH